MMQTPRKRQKALLWGLTAALLLISAWCWLGLLLDAEPPFAPSQDAARQMPVSPLTLPTGNGFENYRATLERPLFHPLRRPFPERKTLVALKTAAGAKQAAAVAPPPPSPPQGFSLRGTVIAGPLQSAVFERSGKGSYVRVRVGEQLEGWILVKIARSEVELRLGDRTVTWQLAKDNENRRRRP